MREVIANKKYRFEENIEFIKNDKMIWFAYLYMILTMQSSQGFIAMFLIFGYVFLTKRNAIIMMMISVFIIIILIILSKYEIVAFQRVKNILDAIGSFDVENVKSTDMSAAYRIAPWFYYADIINVLSIDTWFGYGIDYSTQSIGYSFFGKRLENYDRVGTSFFPGFAIDYGLVTLILFIVYLRKVCFTKLLSYDFLLWCVLFATAPINTYLFWLSVILLATNKYFMKL
jgi:hypothetical protein